jgi:hypothetical protein
MWPCTDPLPNFTKFSYTIVTLPNSPKGRGWEKLKECERHLVRFRLAGNRSMPQGPQHSLPLPHNRTSVDDCLNPFLNALEAAFEFTRDQLHNCGKIHKSKFKQWLRNLPEHDLQIRGLRTLHHLDAHIQKTLAGRAVDVKIEKIVETSKNYYEATEQTLSHRWLLPIIDLTKFNRLHTPELTQGELPDWDELRTTKDAVSILEDGLRKARAILLEAEKLL